MGRGFIWLVEGECDVLLNSGYGEGTTQIVYIFMHVTFKNLKEASWNKLCQCDAVEVIHSVWPSEWRYYLAAVSLGFSMLEILYFCYRIKQGCDLLPYWKVCWDVSSRINRGGYTFTWCRSALRCITAINDLWQENYKMKLMVLISILTPPYVSYIIHYTPCNSSIRFF